MFLKAFYPLFLSHELQKNKFSSKAFYLLLFLSFLSSCFSLKKQKLSLKFQGEQVFEKNKNFKGLKVGGLSGLVFDKAEGYFYALSDDKKNHRFYKMALSFNPHYRLKIKGQVFLKNRGYSRLTRNMDPEALAFYGADKIFIASEGQQIYEKQDPTQIFTFDRQANLQEAWPVPSVFWKTGIQKQTPSFGQQENKGFESLALDKSAGLLWTATEKPLKQDRALQQQSFVRISSFDIETKKMTAQYGYPLEKDGGLTALQFLGPKLFISLERVYKKRDNKGENFAYIFLTNCQKADNIQSQIQLKKEFSSCSKKELWDSSKNPSVKVDNLEGLALGPSLPLKSQNLALAGQPQKQLLVLVSDNNFNESKQKTQFLFFELSRLF